MTSSTNCNFGCSASRRRAIRNRKTRSMWHRSSLRPSRAMLQTASRSWKNLWTSCGSRGRDLSSRAQIKRTYAARIKLVWTQFHSRSYPNSCPLRFGPRRRSSGCSGWSRQRSSVRINAPSAWMSWRGSRRSVKSTRASTRRASTASKSGLRSTRLSARSAAGSSRMFGPSIWRAADTKEARSRSTWTCTSRNGARTSTNSTKMKTATMTRARAWFASRRTRNTWCSYAISATRIFAT